MSFEIDNEYIYVMSNASFDEDVIKIGWSRKHPSLRARQLYTSGLPTPFIIEFVIITTKGNGSKLEKNIHKYLNQYRINNEREFFKINKIDLIEIIINELKLEITCNLLNIKGTSDDKKEVIVKEDFVTKFVKDFVLTNEKNDYTTSEDIQKWIDENNLKISMIKFGTEITAYCETHSLQQVLKKDKKIDGKAKKVWFGIKPK